MMIKRIITFLILVFGISFGYGQEIDSTKIKKKKETYPWSHSKEIGFDFTPLISSLVPFNLGGAKESTTEFSFKRYGRKYAFRFNAGIDINTDETLVTNFTMNIGFERRKKLTDRFSYTSGLDFGIVAINDFPGAVLGVIYGFEYNISQKVFLATEGNIRWVTNFFDDFPLQINAPTSIFLYVRI